MYPDHQVNHRRHFENNNVTFFNRLSFSHVYASLFLQKTRVIFNEN